jgi:hypothetical protein
MSGEEWSATHIKLANEELASMPTATAKWLSYTSGHQHFELKIGKAVTDSLFLCLSACEYIQGPVDWPNQRVTVRWLDKRETDEDLEFILLD